MAWVRGNPLDYDKWEELGAKGWNFKSVLPYFLRSENFQNEDSPWRGNNGPIKVTRGKKVKITGFKKAIVTIKKGQNIDLTTGI